MERYRRRIASLNGTTVVEDVHKQLGNFTCYAAYYKTGSGMKNFLIVLAVSIVASVELYNFGLAAKIWPAHPILCTTLLAWAMAMAVQIFLSNEKRRAKEAKDRTNASR